MPRRCRSTNGEREVPVSPALTLLARLLEIPSVNPMGRATHGPEHLETRLTDFLEGWLRERGAETRRQTVAQYNASFQMRF